MIKKILAISVLAIGLSTNAYSYTIQSNDGDRVSGMCDNGLAFAGSYFRDSDRWDISGPNGYQSTHSMSSSIRKACGE